MITCANLPDLDEIFNISDADWTLLSSADKSTTTNNGHGQTTARPSPTSGTPLGSFSSPAPSPSGVVVVGTMASLASIEPLPCSASFPGGQAFVPTHERLSIGEPSQSSLLPPDLSGLHAIAFPSNDVFAYDFRSQGRGESARPWYHAPEQSAPRNYVHGTAAEWERESMWSTDVGRLSIRYSHTGSSAGLDESGSLLAEPQSSSSHYSLEPSLSHYQANYASNIVPDVQSLPGLSSSYNTPMSQQECSPRTSQLDLGLAGFHGADQWLQQIPDISNRLVPQLHTSGLVPPTNDILSAPSPSSASTSGSSTRNGPRRSRYQMSIGSYPYTCRNASCGAGFPTQAALTHHGRTHKSYGDRQHVCPTCNKRFQYRKDLGRHLPNHDPQAQKFFCAFGDCKYATRGFKRRDHLDRHVQAVHSAKSPSPLTY